jgi:hypothetical protein
MTTRVVWWRVVLWGPGNIYSCEVNEKQYAVQYALRAILFHGGEADISPVCVKE